MDQPLPDQSTPERTEDPATSLAGAAGALPEAAGTRSARDLRTQARLQSKVGPDEEIVAWARGWASRATRLHRVFAARTLDFVVLTDAALVLVSTGFFSRRPRRRVYWSELADLVVADDPVPKGRRLRMNSPLGHELWIELGSDPVSMVLADGIVARTQRATP